MCPQSGLAPRYRREINVPKTRGSRTTNTPRKIATSTYFSGSLKHIQAYYNSKQKLDIRTIAAIAPAYVERYILDLSRRLDEEEEAHRETKEALEYIKKLPRQVTPCHVSSNSLLAGVEY